MFANTLVIGTWTIDFSLEYLLWHQKKNCERNFIIKQILLKENQYHALIGIIRFNNRF